MIEKQLNSYTGKHLANLRKKAGLSQYQLASLLGIRQSTIAFWENSTKPPRSELLPEIAAILNVSVGLLLNLEAAKKEVNKKRLTGKMAKLFEKVSELPRDKQDKMAEVISIFLEQCQLANQNNQVQIQNIE